MLLPATPGWVSLPVVVGVPRHSWLRVPGAVFPPLLAGVRWRRWCAVCGGGVLVGLWLVCGVVGPSPLLAEVPVVDIVPGKAMALDVVTAGGTLTVINVHGPGSGGDSWASKASFLADVAMYAAAKSAGGTRVVLLGGDFNVWLESPWHPTTKRFQALWEQCGFRRAGL